MQNITAQKAQELKLIDEVSDNIDDGVRRFLITTRRLSTTTIAEAKQFFRKMWIINEEMEQCAMDELKKLMSKKEVQNNIKNFILHQTFPWDKS